MILVGNIFKNHEYGWQSDNMQGGSGVGAKGAAFNRDDHGRPTQGRRGPNEGNTYLISNSNKCLSLGEFHWRLSH